MNSKETVELLKRWRDLLEDFEAVEINVDMSSEQIRDHIAKRQQNIDDIQKLDTSLKETVDLRKDGWPGFDEKIVETVETLIAQGRSICDNITKRDRKVVEKTKEIRQQIANELKKVSLGKGYLPSKRLLQERTPVIVTNRI